MPVLVAVTVNVTVSPMLGKVSRLSSANAVPTVMVCAGARYTSTGTSTGLTGPVVARPSAVSVAEYPSDPRVRSALVST